MNRKYERPGDLQWWQVDDDNWLMRKIDRLPEPDALDNWVIGLIWFAAGVVLTLALTGAFAQ